MGNAVLQVPFGIPFFIIITMNEHDCEIPAKKVHCITFGRTQVKKYLTERRNVVPCNQSCSVLLIGNTLSSLLLFFAKINNTVDIK